MYGLGLPDLRSVITVNESYSPSGSGAEPSPPIRPQNVRQTHLDKKILGLEGSN